MSFSFRQIGYEDNYFINELGIVKIYPNVRGSTGYGKKFLDLDNGVQREDAVKDIGAMGKPERSLYTFCSRHTIRPMRWLDFVETVSTESGFEEE